jgi:hypothetical protein
MSFNWGLVIHIVIIGFFGFSVQAEVPEFLKKWSISPRAASFEIPAKKGAPSPLKFLPNELPNKDFVKVKDKARMRMCRKAGKNGCVEDFNVLEAADDFIFVNQFIGETAETNIDRLDALKTGAAAVTPWSGHYWPIYEGGIGVRYGDDKFPHSDNFDVNYQYYQKNYLKKPRELTQFNELSPSEKYDLIAEDKNWSLTKYSWANGKQYYETNNQVETWMGICHGWAPAAFVVPEPKQSVEIKLPTLQNKTLTLYPDDVKALVSQLWAQADVPVHFIGGRCNDKDPKVDENGRIISRNCFDTNPATWHLIVLNSLGKLKKSFVFDATYDYEVWNQPMASYKLKYFNPNDKNPTEDLNLALINYGDFKNDPYKKYRSGKAKKILGIQMEISYVVETMPYQYNGVDESLPSVVETTYYYDLEIDEFNNVIGGEWYQSAHPDMLWKPTIERPVAKLEPQNSYWGGNLPMPFDLLSIAKKNSKYGEPLSAIIDQLVSWTKLN